MIDLCRKHDIVLDAGALRYVAHWVTPVGETPRRFDTRFFLAAAPHGQEGVHDDAETVDSRWVRPADALRDAEQRDADDDAADDRQHHVPRRLRRASTDAIAKADAAGLPPRIQPKIRRDAAGRLVDFSMPGDPDYDALV